MKGKRPFSVSKVELKFESRPATARSTMSVSASPMSYRMPSFAMITKKVCMYSRCMYEGVWLGLKEMVKCVDVDTVSIWGRALAIRFAVLSCQTHVLSHTHIHTHTQSSGPKTCCWPLVTQFVLLEAICLTEGKRVELLTLYKQL